MLRSVQRLHKCVLKGGPFELAGLYALLAGVVFLVLGA
jgi:hypothetical protein